MWCDVIVSDQQTDRVLSAAGPEGEAGERQEEIGQEAALHATGFLGKHGQESALR